MDRSYDVVRNRQRRALLCIWKGKLIAILSSPAEAVQLADENVGVVLNSSQSYVWERGNRQQGMRLDETTIRRDSRVHLWTKRAEGVTR